MATAASTNIDGRRVRSVKTRAAIVDATLALIDEGDLKPAAAAIAARAGLSVRSVFQHFGDLGDLFLAVTDRQTNREASLYTGVVYEGDLPSRIDTFVNYRAHLYEVVSPIRRAALIHEQFSPAVASRMVLARELHRLDLERAFGDELDAFRAAGDVARIAALVAATSFVVWNEMRRHEGHDVEAAAEAFRAVVSALLGPDRTTV